MVPAGWELVEFAGSVILLPGGRWPAPYGSYVYLLHFDSPLGHARHYLGSSTRIYDRLREHRSGHGARLMEVCAERGITWRVSRFWRGGRRLERRLKDLHSGVRLCPICCARPGGAYRVDPVALPEYREVPF